MKDLDLDHDLLNGALSVEALPGGYVTKISRFRTFVSNRVSEILKTSHSSQWRYVNTSSNPADVASRGLKVDVKIVDVFLKNETWLSGPTYVLHPACESRSFRRTPTR